MYQTDTVDLQFTFTDQACRGRIWNDSIRLETAEALGTFLTGPLAGNTCLSRHTLGRGAAYYRGTLPDRPGLLILLKHLSAGTGLASWAEIPENVVIGQRVGPEGRTIFLINFNSHEVTCKVNHSLNPAQIILPARDVIVVKYPTEKTGSNPK